VQREVKVLLCNAVAIYMTVLFGRKFYNPKEEAKRIPEDVQTLDMVPIKTTGKYPTMWEELDADEAESSTPATDGDSIKMLIPKYPEHAAILQLIMDYKAVNQVLKNFLRPPEESEEDDEEVYNSGWISRVDDDQVIRGTYLQTTETGRFRSLKPNLNNMSSGDAEYDVRKLFATGPGFFDVNWKKMDTRELIGLGLLHPDYDILRSVVRARPGYVLIGADFKQAELACLATISGDPDMLKAMADPDIDLHCRTAVRAFGLKVPEGEKEADWVKVHHMDLRSASKTIIFGYGVIWPN